MACVYLPLCTYKKTAGCGTRHVLVTHNRSPILWEWDLYMDKIQSIQIYRFQYIYIYSILLVYMAIYGFGKYIYYNIYLYLTHDHVKLPFRMFGQILLSQPPHWGYIALLFIHTLTHTHLDRYFQVKYIVYMYLVIVKALYIKGPWFIIHIHVFDVEWVRYIQILPPPLETSITSIV